MVEQGQVIPDTFSRTLSLVAEAEKARGSDEPSYKLLLWKVAAEAEYLAFQLSLTKGLADYDPASNDDENSDPIDPLGAARTLLEQARSSIESDPKESYRAVRKVVSVLRTTYVGIDKPSKQKVVSSPRSE